MNRQKTLLHLENESEILTFLENFFPLNDCHLSNAVKFEEILHILAKAGLTFVLYNLEFHPISEKEYLKKVRKGNSDTLHEFSSGYWEIKFGHDSEKRKNGTLYFSRSWDQSIFDESFKETLDCRKRSG